MNLGPKIQLGGSKWGVIVLYEQGVTLQRSSNPTCLYKMKKEWRLMCGGTKNVYVCLLAVLSPETASGAVVIKT